MYNLYYKDIELKNIDSIGVVSFFVDNFKLDFGNLGTAGLNDISPQAKKQITNTVYFLGTNLQLESNINVPGEQDTRIFAFVIKKSFWKNKMSLELRSADNYMKSIKFDDYKNYTNREELDIFDIESLVVIKYFLLSFAS